MFLLVYPGLVSNFIALKYEFIGMVANIKHLSNYQSHLIAHTIFCTSVPVLVNYLVIEPFTEEFP